MGDDGPAAVAPSPRAQAYDAASPAAVSVTRNGATPAAGVAVAVTAGGAALAEAVKARPASRTIAPRTRRE